MMNFEIEIIRLAHRCYKGGKRMTAEADVRVQANGVVGGSVFNPQIKSWDGPPFIDADFLWTMGEAPVDYCTLCGEKLPDKTRLKEVIDPCISTIRAGLESDYEEAEPAEDEAWGWEVASGMGG